MAISKILNSLRYGDGSQPVLLSLRSSKPYVVFTVSVSIFTDMFLYGVIVPVVPWALHQRAGVPEDETQYWVSILLAVYGATLLAGSPIAGYMADVTSTRRSPFILGLLLLIGATVMLCVADSLALFIIGRALQGFSSSIVWVAGLVIIVDTAGQKDVGQYMGYTGLAMSLGVLLAPLLGGVVYDRAGYYAVYAMCFAILIVDVFLRLTMVETKVAQQWLNRSGEAELSAQSYTSNEKDIVSNSPEQDQQTLKPHRELGTDPAVLLPPRNVSIKPDPKPKWYCRLPPIISLLGSRRLLASLWGSMIQAALLTSLDSTVPLRVRTIFGWNSLGAGLIFVPLVLPTFAGPVVGYFSDRYGPKLPATFGFIGAIPALVCLRFVTHNTLDQKILLCALLAILGLCVSVVLTPFMAEIGYIVEEKERRTPGTFGAKGAYAQAYGLFNLAFAGGCLIGPIWGGLVKEKAGWNTMVWSLGLLSGFSVLVTFGWVGGWVGSVGLLGGGGHGSGDITGHSEKHDTVA